MKLEKACTSINFYLGAVDSSETSGDPDRDPEEVQKIKDELHLLVHDQHKVIYIRK